ncbi:probable translation elongation factor 2 -putative [Pseudozyma flocculosa]|uniref:Elongation factor-like 1 n=1 Tax=Pseudozyma flocculosa TaxID=84751 RepID=A0A5C3ET33_9BASI|nr:probable translation elongation factor 2 -putative [Pseudozyma flocculosa]
MASSSKKFTSHNVRCCTLIGHVDHGKSSFADSLLAANNIISARMAGQIRYLDSREDEQERGITMEASAVSLSVKMRFHDPKQGWDPENLPPVEDFMINLGVCAQTITVLRQAWQDGLEPILVLNKMDRLITELKLSPYEAYHHLIQVIEQVNAVMGSFFATARMDDDQRWHEEREKRIEERRLAKNDQTASEGDAAAAGAAVDDDEHYEERDDEDIYFDPAKGNVIFASAMDNWAFRLERFAMLYAKKMGIQEQKLRKVLWGDFYFDPKAKRVIGHRQKEKEKRPLKPMFVQFVLENIWAVYDSVVENRDQERIEKIVNSLSLKIHPRDLKSKDPATLIKAIFGQWLPLAGCAFAAIVYVIPPTSKAQQKRVPMMLNPDMNYFDRGNYVAKTPLESDLMQAATGSDAHTVAYVSKMFAVKKEDLPEGKRTPLTADEMRQRAKESREKASAVRAALAATGATIDGADGEQNGDAPASAEPSSGTSLEEAGARRAERIREQQQRREEEEAAAAKQAEEEGSDEVVLGFARLYSGTLRAGSWVYAVLPKYNAALPPSHPANSKHVRAVKLESLYMMMGRDLLAVSEVPAGNVFAVRGLEGKVLRNATLCAPPLSQDYPFEERQSADEIDAKMARSTFVNLAGINLLSAPIVRVALEPANPSDMPKLVEGLKLLNQADPCVESLIQDSGEHVILTAGELHLERCLKDLRERFAKCEIQVSPPLVPFRETAVRGIEMPPPKTEGAARGTIDGSVANGLVSFRVRAVPLPKPVVEFLLANDQTIRRLQSRTSALAIEAEAADVEGGASIDAAGSSASKTVKVDRFWAALEDVLRKCGQDKTGEDWREIVERIWSFGPRRVGPNLLIDRTNVGGAAALHLRDRTDPHRLKDSRPASGIATPSAHRAAQAASSADKSAAETLAQALDAATLEDQPGDAKIPINSTDMNESIDAGFQMATNAGPMCAEPMQGMAFFVEAVEIDKEEVSKEGARARLSQVAGSMISAVREVCRNGLLDWSPRLMLAMYSCDIQASTEVLGKVHAVLSRRRGRIISEEMKEGTSFFTVGSLLPVVESFGFADEIRKRTSGAASPQLIFKGFEMFDLDPYWVPRTEEELEDLGEKGDRENVAKRYMDGVRKRKGMFVTQRIVEAAEKQRTLKSN